MCLIFISLHHHPNYKLIVAGNRDEFYSRPTLSADFWPEQPEILAGRDLEAGGTWLGVTRKGNLSMLTNYRDPSNIDPKAPSRGNLVSDFLKGGLTPELYLKRLEVTGKRYNGFNLLVGNADGLWYYSNYNDGVQQLTPGFYGISNKLLETPWPKVVRGKQMLEPVLDNPIIDLDEVFNVLYDDLKAPTEQLPNTGLTPDRERALSSMFIKTDNYGTRCSSIILVDRDGQMTFSERAYDMATFEHQTKTFRLTSAGNILV